MAQSNTITLLATSRKGKSRIGTQPTPAVVEQSVGGRLFVVLSPTQCRWIQAVDDPDFVIVLDR